MSRAADVRWFGVAGQGGDDGLKNGGEQTPPGRQKRPESRRQYRAAFSNRFGDAYTSAGTLTVTSATTVPPVVTLQPTAPATDVMRGNT